jgi:hypothetical protein
MINNIVIGEIISTTTIPATTEKFITKDNFVVNTENDAKVKISYLGDNFKTWFGAKTENPFSGSSIIGRQLIKGSVDAPILKELGGNEKAETTLTEIYAMMQKQANGEDGDLLTNDSANIFYVKDINNTLRAVSVSWFNDGWDVNAFSIEYSYGWVAHNRVFSRDSSVA